MEVQQQQQQQQQGEQKQQSQELSDENNISLLDMCQNSDMYQLKIKILLLQVSVKKIRMKTIMNKMILEIFFTILAIVYFAVEVSTMESKEEILAQNL